MYLLIQQRDPGEYVIIDVTNDLERVRKTLKLGGTVYNLNALPKLKELHVDYTEVYEKEIT